jgi:hypothetical protein
MNRRPQTVNKYDFFEPCLQLHEHERVANGIVLLISRALLLHGVCY